ncbi:MAG: BolA family transcriptional regulator [Alphaproteobacteria bacterium]|nr:BolA family transcriptional regulator [Alphaproteobacteria bacterium]
MSVGDMITERLTAAFQPSFLRVTDESRRHEGHTSVASVGGETHFDVRIVSSFFSGKSRLERHQMVNNVLGNADFYEKVHALSLDIRSPDEEP